MSEGFTLARTAELPNGPFLSGLLLAAVLAALSAMHGCGPAPVPDDPPPGLDTTASAATADDTGHGECAFFPPGICWCGAGCFAMPPSDPCDPVPDDACGPGPACALDPATLWCVCGEIQADPRSCGCVLVDDACSCDGVPMAIDACVPVPLP